MTEHEHYKDDLKAYLDRELPLPRRIAVRRHVDTCPPCREELLQMTQVTEQLRAGEAASTIDPALKNKILSGYGKTTRTAALPRRAKPIILSAIAAVGVFIIAAIIFPFFAQSRDKGRSMDAYQMADAPQPAATKSIGLAMSQYAQETDESYPAGGYPASSQSQDLAVNVRSGFGHGVSGTPHVEASGATIPATDTLRQVHKEASIGVEVTDPEAQGDTVESMVKDAGGYVASNNLTTGDDGLKTASMTVKVPVAQFETILGQIAKLGNVKAKNVTGEDITDKVSDAAQAENVLEDEVHRSDARLKALGKKASWDDSETARDLRIRLAQARARLVLLKKLGEMSEIDVTLTQKPKASAPPASGFVGNMSDTTKDAFGSMASAVAVLLTGVIWIVVYAPIWLPLGFVGRWAYRRYRATAA